ncbi:MAG: gamma-glutamyltransferase [Ignavibacteriales bacterium]|nr:gamma-glutamyltransferase [Ignavibacteriales bacterium]MCB9258957.1 gamma-glutamyltransferase [Ignavibacteriales bacterium]
MKFKITLSFTTAVILLFSFLFSNNLSAQIARPIKAKQGMVVSACSLASEVGINILKKGGNAVDASVAVGFALAVTYPYAGNLGGGGFMVIHLNDGKNTSIDYREKAPSTAHKDMYLDKDGNYLSELSQSGITSVGVPGSVAGLIFALDKYGTMKLEEVISPAIDLAINGFILDESDVRSFNYYKDEFEKYSSSKKIFLKDKERFEEGDLFVQKDLAFTLEQIRTNGKDGFYKGKVADLFITQVEELNGYITHEDLEKYAPIEREPILGMYRDHKIVSMGPPSSGGIALVELLNILENFSFEKQDWNSSSYINKLVETMKYVYADRTYHLGDEDFYLVPKEKLTSKEYAKSIFEKLTDYAIPSEKITTQIPVETNESTETTHYSVYDKYGNAVSVTTTINSGFGSKIVVDGAGFLLNNEMDDFSSKPGEPNQFGLLGGKANSIEAGKRMLSAMTPTIVLKDDKPFVIVGSPGGSTIITVVLQVIINVIDFGMNIQEAVNAPRIHHQWMPDIIYLEEFAVNKDVYENLEKMGYSFGDRNKTFRVLGSAQSIMIDGENIYGAPDPRRSGSAIGY